MRSKINASFFGLMALVAMLIVDFGCGKKKDNDDEVTPTTDTDPSNPTPPGPSGSLNLNLAGVAAKALPLSTGISSGFVPFTLADSWRGYTGITWKSSMETTAKDALVQYGPFRLECHNDDNSINNCPTGVALDMNSKYSSTTLIGLIFSADQYFANEIFRKDTTACTMTGASALNNHTPVYTGSSQWLYGLPHYDCLFVLRASECTWCGVDLYYTYKKTTGVKANEVYSLLGSQYKKRFETFSSTNSQVQQLYLRNGTDEKPEFMAYSLAAYAAYDNPANGAWESVNLIMLNIKQSRFFIKYGTSVVAIGKGGYNKDTGTIVGGNFVAKLNNGGTDEYYCLTQATNGSLTFDGTGAACDGDAELKDFFKKFFAADSGFWDKTGTDTAKAFFGVTDAEIDTELAPMGLKVNRVAFPAKPSANGTTQFPSAIAVQ